ncbi:MAG: sigma-70 family RNA polymerase sigma factor [Verrucomicrobiaceae bacterium]|nr:sigma-70 family RNA polymerase sigma factor [Verrucomicrobiaceae bacterium]
MDERAPHPEAETNTSELIPVVYEELRKIARGQMSRESGPQTLSATALVHEAWLRVGGEVRWQSRRHFFGAAAEAMRRILIERARAKARMKRGGAFERVELEDLEIEAPTTGEDLIALDEALAKFMREDPEAAEIVSLRYFAGLKWSEIAEMTGMSERELNRQWEYARAWLRTEMSA